MKKISILLILFAPLLIKAQTLVVDPVLTGTLVATHSAQQEVLNNIHSEEKNIQYYQGLISVKLVQLKELQDKTYQYLSTVNAVVKNGKDIVYASVIAADIFEYQTKATDYAAADPKLLVVVAKTEYELISRSADLMLYIYNVALASGEKNLLDNKQRIDLCIHVVNELRSMRGLAYAVCRQMKFASREGILKTLMPGQFRYAVNMKSRVDRMVNDVNWIIKK